MFPSSISAPAANVWGHFSPRRSVLARAWERLQGSLPLMGSFAPATDFGAEVGMRHGLGLWSKDAPLVEGSPTHGGDFGGNF